MSSRLLAVALLPPLHLTSQLKAGGTVLTCRKNPSSRPAIFVTGFTHPIMFALLANFHELRFTNLIFVGYTADGYKKGLCHETPTAEELAGLGRDCHNLRGVLYSTNQVVFP